MRTAAKVVRCIAHSSHASLNPAAALLGRLTAQLRCRFISSSGKDRKAAAKVEVESRRTDVIKFLNKTGVKPAEVGVGDDLTVGVKLSLSTGIPKKTSGMDQGSRLICPDIQATTPIDYYMIDTVLPICAGLYRNPHSRTHAYGSATENVLDIALEQVAKLNGIYTKEIFTSGATGSNDISINFVARFSKPKEHITVLQTEQKCVLDLCQDLQDEECDITYLPIDNSSLINLERWEKEIHLNTVGVSIITLRNNIRVMERIEEIGKLYQKQGVIRHTNGEQVMGQIPVEVGKWNMDWISISSAKVYGPKHIRTCHTHCEPEARINTITSGRGKEHSLRSRALTLSFLIGFGEARRIAQGGVEYTCTSEPCSPLNSICSSAVRDSYIHTIYHNKQPKQFTRALQTMSHNKPDTKKRKRKATTDSEDSGMRVQKANLANATEGRNRKWDTSYSKITIRGAEKRLGLRLELPGIPVTQILEGKKGLLGPDVILKVKRKIYQDLVCYLNIGGYPTEANPDFKEANINDIVAFTIYPILNLFKLATKRNLRLSREKEIISKDFSTSGMEEFVVMDYISYDQEKYVLIVEAKKVSLGEARKQCFLAMRDIWDYNGGGAVYGFVTMGDSWRMVSFDGTFKMSSKIELLFDTMGEEEEEWMANYSILIDCLNVALSHGGKDLVEVV